MAAWAAMRTICVHMTVIVNGQSRELPDGETVSALLARVGLAPDKVAVELNRRILRTDKYETALKQGGGVLIAQVVGGDELRFSEHYACPVHGALAYGPFEPRDFSFNNPRAACPTSGATTSTWST